MLERIFTPVATFLKKRFIIKKNRLEVTNWKLLFRKVKKVASREESTIVLALSVKEEKSDHFLYAIQQRPKTGKVKIFDIS